ncbi:MAG TPA: replicative DNA helicase [Rubrobacter sp.]|nr:replicative DNA helicase [Rubrobacter sp.]
MERRGRIRSVETGADAARVPPHDLDAERAVIGAMLVSETAVAAVAERLAAEDFYSEVHRIIYGAMMRLYSRGDPIDQLTLTNELRSVNEFERIGGRPYVFQIVESVPTAANAGRYADIVRGKALLRAVIDVGSRITEDAFREPENVSEALDSAEQLIYGVSNKTLREHLAPVSELAPGALEMIQRLYEQEGEVTGVETGFEDLDRLTTGFHKSDLVILAARPAMGKTAMALNAIWHAAGEKKMPVAIFSLEMSKEQLVQRLISQTTRIPAQALRSGNVKAEDWPKLVRGVAEVSKAPIWIDDTAGVTLMEIRAKVRRLSSQLNAAGKMPLSLVVVDYLQLMVGQGSRSENRQQEIAEISRGLKVLARDLDVPVLAIAQLSRAVEARHDKRPLLSDLRDCVTGDTLVSLADGRRVPVRELVGTRPHVLSMSPEGKIVEAEAARVWSVGRRPVFSVRLASGRVIRATARHRLFGADGWIQTGELRTGDRIALARSVPEPQDADKWPEARLALLGHLIGDGSYLSGQPMRYCTSSEENSLTVTKSAVEEFGVKVNRYAGRGNWHQLVLSGNGNRWHPAGVNHWLRQLGIFGQRSHEKRVPESVFSLSNDQIAVLLKHLWATDGTIFARRTGTKGSSVICFSTNSRGLADDVAALLLRLRIVARIREVSQGSHRAMFTVSVSGTRDQKLFLERVGAFGPRRSGAQRLAQSLETRQEATNVDTLPIEFFAKVKAAMAARGVSHRAMAVARGTAYGGSSRFRFAPSRTLMVEYAGLLDDETLLAFAESDLFWDRVIEVVPCGEEEVFDLTVPGPASWLADGIVSHNSGAIEQDADMVMFLYRDEYYNPDSDDKGIAEVIVGKHRNGPTGKVQLAWMEQYTKFASLARRV